MKLEDLKSFYNRIDSCSISLDKEVDFEYIQQQISKIAIFTDDLNRIIGQILIEITRLEHLLTDSKFEFDLKVTDNLTNNVEVKKLGTIKERTNYIHFFILQQDFRTITNLEQELRDSNSLLKLAEKKARDLDRTYPKLKTLWESVQSEVKNIKKLGSDSDFVEKVRNSIDDDQKNKKPIFTDNLVEQMKLAQYNEIEDNTEKNSVVEQEVDDLLNDI